MTNAVEITLAALVSLAANFHAGLDNLNNKNYDKAIGGFTSVLSAKVLTSDIHELSLLYRAEAYAAKGDKEKALQDAGTLLKTTGDAGLRRRALTLYTGQGGVLQDLRPKDGPKARMDKFFAAVRASDFKAARELISGPLLAMLDTFDQAFAAESGRSFLAEMGRNLNDFSFISENVDDTNQTATLSLSLDRGRMTFSLGLVQRDGQWTFSSLQSVESERARRRAGREGATSVMANLKQIGLALRMYASDHREALPASLDDLKPYIGDNPALFLCADPATGKQQRFLYRSGVGASDAPDTIVAATPFVSDGRRIVLRLDGSVEAMSEETFGQKVSDQKWVIAGLVKKGEVDKAVAAEVTELIGKLGDSDFKTRDGARKRLKAIGAAATPFLMEQKNHPDPEVRMVVLELLK